MNEEIETLPNLDKADQQPIVMQTEGCGFSLCVLRDEGVLNHPISKEVAAELVAAGFTYTIS